VKILVMGAGAVGAYFGARLQQAGEQVVFCCRGENLRELRRGGLRVESHQGDFQLEVSATDDSRENAPYDLILFCVKSYDTDTAARSLAGCISQDGVVLTLQNGVENEARLCEIFGRNAVMGGNARVGAELVAPAKLVHRTGGFIQFGELDGRETSRGREIAQMFQRAGILGEFTTSLASIRWEKLLWNAAFNSVTALTRSKVGDVIDDIDGAALLRALMSEIVAVAEAEGVALSRDQIEAQMARSYEQLREVRTSTQQDSERGKRLEFEALSGAVVRAADRHGIEVPHMKTVHVLMRLLDATRA
jgi:2-dehydropantoate 2-reductase